jgi:hypothetical protein
MEMPTPEVRNNLLMNEPTAEYIIALRFKEKTNFKFSIENLFL